MKVILSSESFPPNVSGVATATVNLAENLTKAGHEAFVLTPGETHETTLDKDFPKYKVYRLKSITNPFRHGYRVTFVSDAEVEKLVQEIRPDIIHLQDPATIGQALRRVGKKLGIPVIITNHFSLEYAMSYLKALSPFIPLFRATLVEYLVLFYNKCDAVTTPTETFRRQIVDWGVKTPVYAVSNGIKMEKFLEHTSEKQLDETRKKFNLPEKPTALYLGRVDKDKSIEVLVRAIPTILKKVDAHFIIAGTGGELERMKSLVADLNIDSHVTFIGFIEHNSSDFVNLYKCATLFAIPSTIETQSLVTLEAMSAGIPIVAARAGALPELAHNGKNGYLFTPGRSDQLAARISKILRNHKLATRMGKESIKIATPHQMDRAFGEMLKLYEKVIKNIATKKDLAGDKVVER